MFEQKSGFILNKQKMANNTPDNLKQSSKHTCRHPKHTCVICHQRKHSNKHFKFGIIPILTEFSLQRTHRLGMSKLKWHFAVILENGYMNETSP